MTKTLQDHIVQQIALNGPMDVGTYMELALGHPRLGYYMTRDPFGQQGDFVTAPEISQMFGELIGAWIADLWMRNGYAQKIYIMECGPGRGTLMSDIMRVTARIPGFHKAVRLYLIEVSPVLKKLQEEQLSAYSPQWTDHIENIPDDAPLMCIGNEFLDALPVRQFQKDEEGWCERLITANDSKVLSFGLSKMVPSALAAHLDSCYPDAEPGNVAEYAPVRDGFVKKLARKVNRNGGAALFIDYGYESYACGETLQALRRHAPVPVLEAPGEVDLTAHVNFGAVKQVAVEEGTLTGGPVTQKDFLMRLGLRERQAVLEKRASAKQKDKLQSDYDRLTAADQMGELFKVITFYHKHWAAPAGFD